MTHPLSGYRVIDFTRVVSGPFCTMQLGDLGAEVIKIEHPRTGDDTRAFGPPHSGGESFYYLSANRNKKSVVLDLARPEGRTIAVALIAASDIVIENFRPGVMKRLGLDYASLARDNPRLIYCSISAYGTDGPMGSRPGYDPIIQAEFGMMSLTGEPDGEPLRTTVPVIDTCTALYASMAILSAALVRSSTGKGQQVEVSLMGAGTALLGNTSQYYFCSGNNPPRMGNAHPSTVPTAMYHTRSGAIYLALANDRQFEIFCREILKQPQLLDDERFASMAARARNPEPVRQHLRAALLEFDRDKLLADLNRVGIPGGAVRTIAEAMESPEMAAAGMVATVEHPTAGPLRMLASPMKFSASPTAAPMPPPLHGQHTQAVLRDVLGYDSERIAALRDAGIIG